MLQRSQAYSKHIQLPRLKASQSLAEREPDVSSQAASATCCSRRKGSKFGGFVPFATHRTISSSVVKYVCTNAHFGHCTESKKALNSQPPTPNSSSLVSLVNSEIPCVRGLPRYDLQSLGKSGPQVTPERRAR